MKKVLKDLYYLFFFKSIGNQPRGVEIALGLFSWFNLLYIILNVYILIIKYK